MIKKNYRYMLETSDMAFIYNCTYIDKEHPELEDNVLSTIKIDAYYAMPDDVLIELGSATYIQTTGQRPPYGNDFDTKAKTVYTPVVRRIVEGYLTRKYYFPRFVESGDLTYERTDFTINEENVKSHSESHRQ